MLDQYSLPLIIAAVSALISVISIIIALTAIGRYKSIYRQYDAFMRGRDAESLEDLIVEEKQRIEALEKSDLTNKEVMRAMNRNIRASFQKAGVVRYDAFEGMGGKMSFAAALLDYTNTGIILNCMHGTAGCFLYIKEVEAGATDVQLGAEEKGALERALGYVED
ncbi:MAG: DUF4446 family protein [Lachnospiraceae bacterium]|nr:DUF4446 family protein [Lachnospiraceae bacterium]